MSPQDLDDALAWLADGKKAPDGSWIIDGERLIAEAKKLGLDVDYDQVRRRLGAKT